MPLRRQFILVFVTFSAILTALGGWLAWELTSRTLEEALEDKLMGVTRTAAAMGLQGEELGALRPGDEELLVYTSSRARLRHLLRYVSAAYVFDRENRVLVATTEAGDSLPIGQALREVGVYPEVLEKAWSEGEASSEYFEEQGVDYKWGFVRLGQSDAMLAVRIRADYRAPLNEFRTNILVSSGIATLFAALLAALMATTVTRPVERLSFAARRIRKGRMDRAVPLEPGLELGRLSRAMERMRKGIMRRDEQLRLMLAQVAHEIRNPLEGLELFAAAAEETDDSEEEARLLRRIRGEIVALNAIISDFLTFARPAGPVERAEDIRTPIRAAAALVEPEVRKAGGTLEVELPESPLLARVAPDQVKRVTLNLLRNAVRAGERVTVRAGEAGGEVMIAVEDDGPGVSEELGQRIFEPFVTDREQGAGLGLAIVKRLAEANGGRAELWTDGKRRFGSGAEFRVYFRGPGGANGSSGVGDSP